MSTNPSKKYAESVSSNAGNLLSQLPESIITHILSCLPTKDAVRTSVLAKDWEYRWSSIYNVDFDSKLLFSQKSKNMGFVKFLERVVFHCHDIRCFRIKCHKRYNINRIMACISAVLRHNNIESFEYRMLNSKLDVFPRSLLNCNSLGKLVLVSPCILKFPTQFFFPNLIELELEKTQMLNENQSETGTLLLTFPVLERLTLTDCKWFNVKMVEFFVPRLLGFYYNSTDWEHGYDDYYDYDNDEDEDYEIYQYSIKLVGAKIERFSTFGRVHSENILLTGSTVCSASVDFIIGNNQGLFVRKLLRELSSSEKLFIDGCAFKALVKSQQGLPLPRFDKLAKLDINCHMDIGGLLLLLHVTPFLQYLEFSMDVSDEWCDEYDFNSIELVPFCIKKHLKEVKSPCFDGTDDAYGLVKFLIGNGEKLQRFSLRSCCFDDPNEEYETADVKELLAFPKASTNLSIFLDGVIVYP